MLIHPLPGMHPSTNRTGIFDNKVIRFFRSWDKEIMLVLLTIISVMGYLYFSQANLHLAYNDAMSHLNIARRVFDNLQPGFAQLGSVWLPLPHLLMLPEIWSNMFWQTGFAGSLISMISFTVTSFFTFLIVKEMTKSSLIGAFSAILVALNINNLYLQTTALTEPLFMAIFTSCAYFFYRWIRTRKTIHLIMTAFLVFLMTLTRYDGWFVLLAIMIGVFTVSYKKEGFKKAEGDTILFSALAGFGILLWVLYNLVIFNDPFYFALGEYSAKSQQNQLLEAGELTTKGNLMNSIKTYYYAVTNNIGFFVFLLSVFGILFSFIKERRLEFFVFAAILLSVAIFNILALYLGFSVIFLPETTGDSWFNVRYGLVILPVAGIFIGYLLGTRGLLYYFLVPLIIVFETFNFYRTGYAVTVIDGTIGSSQKNVAPTGRELKRLYENENGLILGSAASHDAIFFASGIPLKNFIHEGVSRLWEPALNNPEGYAEYIVMRTYDELDSVCRSVCQIKNLNTKYELKYDGEFADIYKRRY